MHNVIEVHDVSKKYKDGEGEVVALQQISLSLPERESMVIIGASGSGKTTLLQLLGGLDAPTSGDIVINGQRLQELSDNELSSFRNKTIGFVFQFFHLHEYLTAQENVALPLVIHGLNQHTALRKAATLLEQVNMKHRIRHVPKQMSGGEMQRVAIARALANEPKIILADEPTGNLDKDNAQNVLKVFDGIAKQGVSVIMITHDETMKKRFHHSLHLNKGTLVQ